MAYQSRQPCMPPPVNVPQCSTQDTCSSSCVSRCNDTCASLSSGGSSCGSNLGMPYQTTQPCLPPPCCAHSGPTETMNICASPCVSFYNIADGERCSAPSVELSSPTPGGSSTTQPLPSVVQPCSDETVEQPNPPFVTLCASEVLEEPMAPSREAMLHYVMPGSVVSLDPCGTVMVKPGPVGDGESGETRDSVFVGSYTPHF